MLKPGCVPAVIYFRYPDGHLTLAPFTDAPTPKGAIREGADTLSAVDRLEKILQEQEYRLAEQEMESEERLFAPRRQAIRDKMYAHMVSSETDQFNKDFYRAYIDQKDEGKKKVARQRYLERSWYLHALHYDLGDRDASKEEVNLDKVNF